MTTDTDRPGRPNQRRRTRKDLLRAASRLIRLGRQPSLEEIAEEAMVSRATAYRYFPDVESLLVEASIDIVIPTADELFAHESSCDAIERMNRVDDMFSERMAEDEAPYRLILAASVRRGAWPAEPGEMPLRQNRRSPLIEAALAPLAETLDRASFETLGKALALLVGIESMIVMRDVLQVDAQEARRIKRWAIRALIEAAGPALTRSRA